MNPALTRLLLELRGLVVMLGWATLRRLSYIYGLTLNRVHNLALVNLLRLLAHYNWRADNLVTR